MRGSPVSSTWILILAALYIVIFGNVAFFRSYLEVYGSAPSALAHMLSVAVLLLAVLLVVLSLVCWPGIQKPLLTLLFFMTAMTAYFMDTYNVVIDGEMISNLLATDAREVSDLISLRMMAYLFVLGIVPSILVWMLDVRRERPVRAVMNRLALAGCSLVVAVGLIVSSGAFYSSYLRENRALRYFSNPLTPLYSLYKAVKPAPGFGSRVLNTIGIDAEIPETDVSRELVVMVVGETARADRFSLNGYGRDTNPELSRLDVVSFSNVMSCGTTTLVSLPCMFSIQGHADFDRAEFDASENALDVLKRAGVNVLWRDNNSSSKGVAVRVPQQDFRSPDVNPDCDVECRDEGMLSGLREFVDGNPEGDILIVLHQMGSHGPAYYRRYPSSFDRFQPGCESTMLDQCQQSEIENSYDNSILYTDHFLASVIDFLKGYDPSFETVMFYISDHGESLGESGVYLHGYPYLIAPDEQIRVPMIMWFGKNYYDADPASVRAISSTPLSHDNIFHTLLGLFEIESGAYEPSKDILQLSREAEVSSARPGVES